MRTNLGAVGMHSSIILGVGCVGMHSSRGVAVLWPVLWAGGEDWGALLANTSLDGGDIFRMLRHAIRRDAYC